MIPKTVLCVPIMTLAILTIWPRSGRPDPKAQSEGALAAIASNSYTIDGEHSAVNFRIKHLGVSYTYGRFNKISGKLVFDEKDPEKGEIEVEIAADGVDSNSEKRDQHLRTPDFFNVKQFPKITFKSSKVKKLADRQVEITGDLTLHGATKQIIIKAEHVGSGKDPWGGYRTGFDAVFMIKRSDYGMKFMLDAIGDDVAIHLGIEAMRKASEK